MMRSRVTATIIFAALGLAACNEITGNSAPQTSVAAGPVVAGLSGNSPCSSEIARYQQVVRDDLATGNVEQKVYDQIQRELSRATAACAAGRNGEAHSIVAGSKSKHGY